VRSAWETRTLGLAWLARRPDDGGLYGAGMVCDLPGQSDRACRDLKKLLAMDRSDPSSGISSQAGRWIGTPALQQWWWSCRQGGRPRLARVSGRPLIRP